MKKICWYIKTDTGYRSEYMTFYEAMELAEWMQRNNEEGVTMVKGQMQLDFDDKPSPVKKCP